FSFDESFDYGTRIERLFNEIQKPMIDRIADAIGEAKSILLASHVRPDGDAVGSLLALYHALRYLDKQVVVFCQDKIPDIYGFLPGADEVAGSLGPVDRFDTAVFLDCSDMARIGEEAARVESIKTLITIDHHISNDGEGIPLSLIDASASSTGEILVRLIDRLDVPLTEEIALNLYTALLTDTGSFRYSNTGKETFLLAARLVDAGADPSVIAGQVYERRSITSVRLMNRALGTLLMSFEGKVGSIFLDQRTMEEEKALPEHAEGIVDQVRSIDGVMIAVMYYERTDGTYKVSFRSKDAHDVEEAARAFGGGGHRNASACSMEGSLEDIRERIESVLAKIISKAEAAG
ncbi:MAG: DHH family phosphoesterase, partial [Syntrophales bacterium]|nr:DHH family phosphoesterase [Syntrophales bacterium]